MSKIKSAKAYNHICERYYGEIDEIHDLNFYDGAVEMSMRELLQILDRYRGTAITAVKIAETEAEERHAKELQELKDRAVETFRRCCKYKHDWFCSDLDNRTENGECDSNCNYMQNFTQRLNEL